MQEKGGKKCARRMKSRQMDEGVSSIECRSNGQRKRGWIISSTMNKRNIRIETEAGGRCDSETRGRSNRSSEAK